MKNLFTLFAILVTLASQSQQKVQVFDISGRQIGYVFLSAQPGSTSNRPPAPYPGDEYIRGLFSAQSPLQYNNTTGRHSFGTDLTQDFGINTGQNFKFHVYSQSPGDVSPRANFYMSRNNLDMDFGDAQKFHQPTFGAINGDASSSAANLYIGLTYFKLSPFVNNHPQIKLHTSADGSHVLIKANTYELKVSKDGILVTGLPVFNNNEEAIAAGLVPDMMYRTPDGTHKSVVVPSVVRCSDFHLPLFLGEGGVITGASLRPYTVTGVAISIKN